MIQGSTHVGIATVALTFRISGPSFKPLLLHARFAGSLRRLSEDEQEGAAHPLGIDKD
jgi:hypothetical protein